ncbi:N-acetylmuramoyl-L-alanine amidase [Jejuia pallidilutea]|uniref:N-acetylmuramoyl-L-alanine amidase n=2 Tax=Jejuia pallidilutea TaxID=504487 RepID=A0A090WTE6_9FLAO|nr:N-acetylmuramoyl-L-alanine amidase [Jejuia pallidilutea]GAL70687.1 N-acetylmuramoyl-L-alanine amidase [Jejuia pallidilutea]GAL90565.1 N-acetylmuramoyl-L-alanine amidase [Jejuia pallidilutea]
MINSNFNNYQMKTNTVLSFVCFIIVLTFSSFTEAQTKDKFVVVLDAGHGGKDPGNLGNGYKEKDIALKVVLEVGKQLEKNPNIKVVYTRKTDEFVELFVRGKIANKAKADLFVSVHCDSHTSQAYGAGTFVLGLHRNKTNFEVAKKENSVIFKEDDHEKNYAGFNPNSPEDAISIILGLEEYLDQSIYLASLIQDNFVKLNRKNRKVKQAGFIVLHQTVMPSVLVELGFLTNNKEGRYLNSRKGQLEMSKSITEAILNYKKTIELNTVSEINTKDLIEEDEMEFEGVTFKVQIAASSRKLEPKPYNFKGLNNISRATQGNLYKYFYGSTSDYNQAKSLVKEAKAKGYTSSFVVAFKDGNNVPLTDVLKTRSN